VRLMAIAIVALAVVVGVAPQYTHCRTGASMSGGATKAATTGGAMNAPASVSAMASATATAQPMRCYWSARAEIGVAVPLALAGALLALSRRRETRRVLALLGATLGVVAMLVPTVLIGVCPTATAVCRTTMRPMLLAAGGLVVALCVAALVLNELRATDDGVSGTGGDARVAVAVAGPSAPGAAP